MHPYPRDVIEGALVALDALGILKMFFEGMTSTDRHIQFLIDYLTRPGAESRFVVGVAGIVRVNYSSSGLHQTGPSICSASRWSHLTPDQKANLVEAYKQMLRARIDGPVDITPPADGPPGCLMCGIGAVHVMQSKSHGIWGSRIEVQPAVVGGDPVPEGRGGYICPRDRALVQTHGWGPTAAENSVIDFLGVKPRIEVEFEPFKAWVAMPEGTPPNKTPWQHLTNLEAMREGLDKANAGLLTIG